MAKKTPSPVLNNSKDEIKIAEGVSLMSDWAKDQDPGSRNNFRMRIQSWIDRHNIKKLTISHVVECARHHEVVVPKNIESDISSKVEGIGVKGEVGSVIVYKDRAEKDLAFEKCRDELVEALNRNKESGG